MCDNTGEGNARFIICMKKGSVIVYYVKSVGPQNSGDKKTGFCFPRTMYQIQKPMLEKEKVNYSSGR
jgi:hypothetical protein